MDLGEGAAPPSRKYVYVFAGIGGFVLLAVIVVAIVLVMRGRAGLGPVFGPAAGTPQAGVPAAPPSAAAPETPDEYGVTPSMREASMADVAAYLKEHPPAPYPANAAIKLDTEYKAATPDEKAKLGFPDAPGDIIYKYVAPPPGSTLTAPILIIMNAPAAQPTEIPATLPPKPSSQP